MNLCAAKIAYNAETVAAMKQKREMPRIKNIQRANSINATRNADTIQQYDDLRVSHQKEADEAFKARMDRQTRQEIRKKLKENEKEDKRMVSLTTLNRYSCSKMISKK